MNETRLLRSSVWRQARDYGAVLLLSYGARALQLLANILLARSVLSSTYTSYQTIQQSILSLFFYFSAGITYSFSSLDPIKASAKLKLIIIYAGLSFVGAAVSACVLTPLTRSSSWTTPALIFLSYLVYSCFGLVNATVIKHQLFKLSSAAGLLIPIVLLVMMATGLHTYMSGATLTLISTAAPLAVLLASRPSLGALKQEYGSWLALRRSGHSEGKGVLERVGLGLVLAAPVAVQGGVYSAVLTTAGYTRPSDAQILAMLLPIFSLLMIAPSALINMILFQKSAVKTPIIILPMVSGCIVALCLSPVLTNLLLQVMKAPARLSLAEAFMFIGFCCLMVVAKLMPALRFRTGSSDGKSYVLKTSLVSLIICFPVLLLYAKATITTWECLLILGLAMSTPYMLKVSANAAA